MAGVASKGNLDERNKAILLKGGRGRRVGGGGKRGGGVGGGVQWDFSGLDDEDPSMLSSSLLNMSMDKDIIMEEMGLSLSDKSVLARPLSHGVMQSLQGFGGGGTEEDVKRRGGPKMSPTASILHQINANYREGLITEEEKEEQKAAMLREMKKTSNATAAPSSTTATTATNTTTAATATTTSATNKEVDPDLLDADQSVDLSTDLAQFIGSPNLLWSLSHSGSGNGQSPVPVGGQLTGQK